MAESFVESIKVYIIRLSVLRTKAYKISACAVRLSKCPLSF